METALSGYSRLSPGSAGLPGVAGGLAGGQAQLPRALVFWAQFRKRAEPPPLREERGLGQIGRVTPKNAHER